MTTDGRTTDACLYYKLTYEPRWAKKQVVHFLYYCSTHKENNKSFITSEISWAMLVPIFAPASAMMRSNVSGLSQTCFKLSVTACKFSTIFAFELSAQWGDIITPEVTDSVAMATIIWPGRLVSTLGRLSESMHSKTEGPVTETSTDWHKKSLTFHMQGKKKIYIYVCFRFQLWKN